MLVKAGYLETDGKEGECQPAVTDLCATKDGSLVAVALQRLVLLTTNVKLQLIPFSPNLFSERFLLLCVACQGLCC